jgi:hypothetical protein
MDPSGIYTDSPSVLIADYRPPETRLDVRTAPSPAVDDTGNRNNSRSSTPELSNVHSHEESSSAATQSQHRTTPPHRFHHVSPIYPSPTSSQRRSGRGLKDPSVINSSIQEESEFNHHDNATSVLIASREEYNAGLTRNNIDNASAQSTRSSDNSILLPGSSTVMEYADFSLLDSSSLVETAEQQQQQTTPPQRVGTVTTVEGVPELRLLRNLPLAQTKLLAGSHRNEWSLLQDVPWNSEGSSNFFSDETAPESQFQGPRLGHEAENPTLDGQTAPSSSDTYLTWQGSERALIDEVSYSESVISSRQLVVNLMQKGLPYGLADEVATTKRFFPTRFWIVDNGINMRMNDSRFIQPKNDSAEFVPCSRWDELQSTVEYHMKVAYAIQTPTTFVMMKEYPGQYQKITVAGDNASALHSDQDRAVDIIHNTELSESKTSLLRSLHEVLCLVQTTGHNRGSVLVIAVNDLVADSNGVSNRDCKRELIDCLRSFQEHGVWIVVRLCTRDDEVVAYYHSLRKYLEKPLEILEDHLHVAQEIYKYNPWINYSEPLHRCREMGFHHPLFDVIDERPLEKIELRPFLSLILGQEPFYDAPDANSNMDKFISFVEELVEREEMRWNPVTKALCPWIDVPILRQDYGSNHGSSSPCSAGRQGVLRSLFRRRETNQVDGSAQPYEEFRYERVYL